MEKDKYVDYLITGDDLVQILRKSVLDENNETYPEEEMYDLATFIAADFDSIVNKFVGRNNFELIKDIPYIRFNTKEEFIEESVNGFLTDIVYPVTGFEEEYEMNTTYERRFAAIDKVMKGIKETSTIRKKEFASQRNEPILIDEKLLEIIIKATIDEAYPMEDTEERKKLARPMVERAKGYSYQNMTRKLNLEDDGKH
ncbi:MULTISPECIES: hypothetical protein [Staphylococcus]|uniref:Uncharacterized protein n=1 Tax=Staphylococcus hominis TaxID=1290 RepID=A0A974L1C7_STAHO|nr:MULTISPECIES: hypothetical protein [Staphylococcus]PTK31905.1 hypothetical protein BUZ51_02220 [Staphylococcus hominis]